LNPGPVWTKRGRLKTGELLVDTLPVLADIEAIQSLGAGSDASHREWVETPDYPRHRAELGNSPTPKVNAGLALQTVRTAGFEPATP
jgi:hypothetical protein